MRLSAVPAGSVGGEISDSEFDLLDGTEFRRWLVICTGCQHRGLDRRSAEHLARAARLRAPAGSTKAQRAAHGCYGRRADRKKRSSRRVAYPPNKHDGTRCGPCGAAGEAGSPLTKASARGQWGRGPTLLASLPPLVRHRSGSSHPGGDPGPPVVKHVFGGPSTSNLYRCLQLPEHLSTTLQPAFPQRQTRSTV